MIRLLILCLLIFSPWQIEKGIAVHYAASWGDWQGPVDSRSGIAARQGVYVPPGFVPIAYWDCARLGERGLLSLSGDKPFKVIIADYTADEDIANVLYLGIVAEVPYFVAEQYRFTGGGVSAILYLRVPEGILDLWDYVK